MTRSFADRHPHRRARKVAMQFLYQCLCDRMHYFSEPHFRSFVQYFEVNSRVTNLAHPLAAGSLNYLNDIDRKIEDLSNNWGIDRIARTDLCVLRIASFEILFTDLRAKIAIDEAVELAKEFGSAKSAGFVNGILNQMAFSIGKLGDHRMENRTVNGTD